ncbi:glycosyltransferase 1 [Branchiostoma belcheri]|nr:glycosyltransferase 1 [Branchiostoma belcheri]
MAPRGKKRAADAGKEEAPAAKGDNDAGQEPVAETSTAAPATKKRNADQLAEALRVEFPDVTVETAVGRRNSFECTVVKDDGKEMLVWTGIKKGPPRKLKFPEPSVVALHDRLTVTHVWSSANDGSGRKVPPGFSLMISSPSLAHLHSVVFWTALLWKEKTKLGCEKEQVMTTLLLAYCFPCSGNLITAERIRTSLESGGHRCIRKCTSDFDGCKEFWEFITDNGIRCIMGINACRTGLLLRDCPVPFGLVFGGTDLNESPAIPDSMDLMTATVNQARCPGILLLPPLPQADLHTLMLHTCAVVNSSVSEGMSTAILEAMCLGVPVIARNIAGNAAIITHKETGLLYNSPEEFVSEAKYLLSDEDLCKTITAKAQDYVHMHHSGEAEKQTLERPTCKPVLGISAFSSCELAGKTGSATQEEIDHALKAGHTIRQGHTINLP